MINEHQFEHLNRIYLILKNHLILKKKFKNNSVLISIINVKSNEAYKLLSESAANLVSIPRDIYDSLLSEGLIRMAEKPDKFVITGWGIWIFESYIGTITIENLLRHLDTKFFDLFGEGGHLTEKEKVILFTLITARSFSVESAIDLRRGETVLTCLQSLLQASFRVLSNSKIIIKLKSQDLFGAQGNEHPVSNLIRHTDALPKRTLGIYKNPGQQKYFLDLFNGTKISEESLIILFGFIFGSAMTLTIKQEVSNFCLKNAYEQSTYLYNIKDHRFANPVFDDQFNEALEKYFASQYKWESKRL